MKIERALWPGRRKSLKIRPAAEALLWIAVGAFGTIALTTPQATVRAADRAAAVAPQFELTSASFRRACLKRVIDLNEGRNEEQLVAELNQQCFALKKTAPAAAAPRPTSCANAFTWGPALAASPRTGPCFRQSTAGSPPGWSRLDVVPSPSGRWTGSRPRWG
jgi:hypothetical protein